MEQSRQRQRVILPAEEQKDLPAISFGAKTRGLPFQLEKLVYSLLELTDLGARTLSSCRNRSNVARFFSTAQSLYSLYSFGFQRDWQQQCRESAGRLAAAHCTHLSTIEAEGISLGIRCLSALVKNNTRSLEACSRLSLSDALSCPKLTSLTLLSTGPPAMLAQLPRLSALRSLSLNTLEMLSHLPHDAFPQLTSLSTSSAQNAAGLAVLQCGAFSRLRDLRLRIHKHVLQADMRQLCERVSQINTLVALDVGAKSPCEWPNLQTNLPMLEKLRIDVRRATGTSIIAPRLATLSITAVSYKVISGLNWTSLTDIDTSYWSSVNSYLIAALRAGAWPKLTKLSVCAKGKGSTNLIQALSRSGSSRPFLQTLRVEAGKEDSVTLDTFKTFLSGCTSLTDLTLGNVVGGNRGVAFVLSNLRKLKFSAACNAFVGLTLPALRSLILRVCTRGALPLDDVFKSCPVLQLFHCEGNAIALPRQRVSLTELKISAVHFLAASSVLCVQKLELTGSVSISDLAQIAARGDLRSLASLTVQTSAAAIVDLEKLTSALPDLRTLNICFVDSSSPDLPPGKTANGSVAAGRVRASCSLTQQNKVALARRVRLFCDSIDLNP